MAEAVVAVGDPEGVEDDAPGVKLDVAFMVLVSAAAEAASRRREGGLSTHRHTSLEASCAAAYDQTLVQGLYPYSVTENFEKERRA